MLKQMLVATVKMLEQSERDSDEAFKARVGCAMAVLEELIAGLEGGASVESVKSPSKKKKLDSEDGPDWNFNMQTGGESESLSLIDKKITGVEGDYPEFFHTGGRKYKTLDTIGFTLRQLKDGTGPNFTTETEESNEG